MKDIVQAAVQKTVRDVFPSAFVAVMTEKAKSGRPLIEVTPGYALNRTGFAWEMAAEFIRHGVACMAAKDLAFDTLNTFCADEKIQFGDPQFAWDRDAAITLARELEIENW